jgi:hypothetical protein
MTTRDDLLYFGVEDERLGDMKVLDVDLLGEEDSRLDPHWRDRRQLYSEQIELLLSTSSARLLSREVTTAGVAAPAMCAPCRMPVRVCMRCSASSASTSRRAPTCPSR